MSELNEYVNSAKAFGRDRILDFSERVVYHDIKWANSYTKMVRDIGEKVEVDERTIQLAEINAWMICSSYDEEKIKHKGDGIPETNLEKIARRKLKEFAAHAKLPEATLVELEQGLDTAFFPAEPQNNVARLLIDASVAVILMADGVKHTKRLYQELVQKDTEMSKIGWYDAIASVADGFKFSFPYCHEMLQPRKEKMIEGLLKEKKKLDKRSDLALKRELDISDRELKDLKKNLEKSKARDDRGIQTLFRTTSKNHYTLNEMIDKKANIMITVNSIILSLVLGGVVGSTGEAENVLLLPLSSTEFNIRLLPVVLLTLTSVISVVFAILSIRPDVTHGAFTEEEIRNKGGNLLFYGNFHEMAERDFEWGFMQMMNDREYMYSSMIKDIYHLGITLSKKYRHLRISLTVFMFGLVISVVAFWFTSGQL